MKNWIRRHPFRMLFLMVLATPLVLGGLNYSGMCITQGRWLSDEEKIRAVIENENSRAHVRVNTLSLGKTTVKYYKRIPYKSADEFLELNPNCCAVVSGKTGTTFVDKIFGWGAGGNIIIKNKSKYINEAGAEKTNTNLIQANFTNCGKNPY